jgi:hypothetical protein
VVKILFEEFEDALLLKTGKHRKAGRTTAAALGFEDDSRFFALPTAASASESCRSTH